MNRSKKLLLWSAGQALLCAFGVSGQAAISDLFFTVTVSGDPNVPTLTVTNESPTIEINRFEFTLGDTSKNFDGRTNHTVAPPGGTATQISPLVVDGVNVRSDKVVVVLSNFGPGESFSVDADIDADPAADTFESFTQAFPGGLIKVISGATEATLTIPANPGSWTFRGPTRTLKVRSVVETDGTDYVRQVTVKNKDGAVLAQAIGELVQLQVAHGEQVEITAPQEVYKDIHGTDITSSVLNDPDKIEHDAEERFTAIGISVNNVPLTGDPTLYRFEMDEDTEVEVKWEHDYALTINHDFTATQSQEMVGSTPWAGPLASPAAGNPDPSANKHWVKKGETQIAQIDGQQVESFAHPGLDIRYVVKGYRAFGPPNELSPDYDAVRFGANGIDIRTALNGSVASYASAGAGRTKVTTPVKHGLTAPPAGSTIKRTVRISGSSVPAYNGDHDIVAYNSDTSFSIDVGFVSDPVAKGTWVETTYVREISFAKIENRQQVRKPFNMYGPAGITYLWQIQYGVQVKVDDVGRAALPRVREVTGSGENEIGALEGTYWFDPGAHVKVLSASKDTGAGAQSLNGWINGDGYFFSSSGDVNTSNGLLTAGGPTTVNGSPVATWLPAYPDAAHPDYRGLDIPQLRRPARVIWRYGTGALTVNVTIGQYVFQDSAALAATFTREPGAVVNAVPDAAVATTPVGASGMAVWDPVASRLYPLVPGRFTVPWKFSPTSEATINVNVTATLPFDPNRNIHGHYPHVAGSPPVAVDPDPDDDLVFKAVKYSTNNGVVDADKLFTAEAKGFTVLLFSQIQREGRGQARDYLQVKVVDTKLWSEGLPASPTDAIIGTRISDASADRAGLGTGWVRDPNHKARYNPFIYDVAKLTGLAAGDVYDMRLLRADVPQRVVVGKSSLPGPVIPVNLHPTAGPNDQLVVVWYDDPTRNDTLLWPMTARVYTPKWPDVTTIPRIVIASQLGSEGVDATGADQEVAPAAGEFARATTYDPSRLQQVQIYQQADPNQPGYNPNEEHALTAPSLRFADVSPRPPAIYALRAGDLNIVIKDPSYTSDPYVLAQFFDTAEDEFKMKVYSVLKDDPAQNYSFASLGTAALSATSLNAKPHVTMEAGEPVIPFYPLGVAIGASPCDQTFGNNLTVAHGTTSAAQITYWEDWRGSSWAVSGGENAWFTTSFYYPLAPDFWWRPGLLTPRVHTVKSGATTTAVVGAGGTEFEPQVGDCVAFLPADVTKPPYADYRSYHLPTLILYKSDWPKNPPVLKAGETGTFSGGEYRADHPTTQIAGTSGKPETVETPGLPQILAFASAEVVFDSLNPEAVSSQWATQWTARVVQALDHRTVSLPITNFSSELQPAGGKTRVVQGKYLFNGLSASLQRRLRYDPLSQKLEVFGLVNDKNIGDNTLTASPPAVYVLEPNILTEDDLARIKELVLSDKKSQWDAAVLALFNLSNNPEGATVATEPYLVGLVKDSLNQNVPKRAFGPGLALVPNAGFLNPAGSLPTVSYVTVVENNDATLGGSPITPHIIKVDRRERYRGAIKTVLSDNVFDENAILRHTGDFGAHASDLYFEWWYRPDDGSLNVPPPDLIRPGTPNPWKLFSDPSGQQGKGRYQITLKGNPNTPEALLADSWWFVRYRHKNEKPADTNWKGLPTNPSDGSTYAKPINFAWAGAGNSDPLHDFDLDGLPDYRAQLAQGWIKRVLDAVNPYEARIRSFEGESPATVSSMITQFGARFEGPVALNPDKNVIENVGLIELYETILKRGRDLSIDLSRPVSTPAVANALQLASTRISDFYTILGNEAYGDALDPTIGFGSDSVEYGSLAPAVFSFQNQASSLIEEELGLLRGVDDFFARPVYNRFFWNFTKGEGEAAYAMNYNISDISLDGFIDEDDAMVLYPQGHGDAWGHYLTALRNQYELLRHPFFNWVSRSEFYNLQDIVIKVDFLDERKFAQTAAAKAKVGAEIVNLTYRNSYVEDPDAQWQGYTDSNADRAWGVEDWAQRAGQGAYFDWVTANALLPSEHPDQTLEGIQKVDRKSNSDISVISANLNAIQSTLDSANKGRNPLGLDKNALVFDIDPTFLEVGSTAQIGTRAVQGLLHFDQIYERALKLLQSASAVWDNANESRNMLRQVGNSETEQRNSLFQEDLTYRNSLIQIFGKPYEGTVGPGKMYPAGYDGPDLALYMYVPVRQITTDTVPSPSKSWASFAPYLGADGKPLKDAKGNLIGGGMNGGDLYNAFLGDNPGLDGKPDGSGDGTGGADNSLDDVSKGVRALFTSTFSDSSNFFNRPDIHSGLFSVSYTDLTNPKVPLENFTQQMPVTAAGYTFQAPREWGSRPATGELQLLISQMIQKEAEVAEAIGAWDSLSGEIVRILRLINSRLTTSGRLLIKEEGFSRVKLAITNTIKAVEAIIKFSQAAEETELLISQSAVDATPKYLPTAGLAFSPGDALFALRAGIGIVSVSAFTGLKATEATTAAVKTGFEIGLDAIENELNLFEKREERDLQIREWLKDLEDKAGDEPIRRITIFKEIQALRELSDNYRSKVDEGSRLIDERAAFNKRAAAQTQRNRYQDMTFRVSRNAALKTYRESFDLAAKYAYLAAKAYDYETNYSAADPGNPQGAMGEIIRARTIGNFDGDPRFGQGGLSQALAWLKANYEVEKGQLGFNNVQRETGKLSLRTEMMRILPKGSTQPQLPVGSPAADQFPGPGKDADVVWREALQNARVPDLWDVPEFRFFCRPFAAADDASGAHVAQPGLVIPFGTEITAGKNFFGRPLSGADHAYDPSNFTTKIVGVGLWFDDYQSADVLNDLAGAPRVYLVPVGSDIMRVPKGGNPDLVRIWQVVDQAIPVPFPATGSNLDNAAYIPLLDSLNGRFGEQRKFSSFRAYHNGGSEFTDDEFSYDTRLVGRSIWNTHWLLIIPGQTLNADAAEGLNRFIDQVTDIKLVFDSYGQSGG